MQLEVAGNKVRKPILAYWPEIDGLRSIAVLSVFLFHLDRRILSGGFVGVDIFFVISGFLITSVLLNDIDQGHFSITRFYQRRIARIAPAFFVVILVVLGVGAIIYSEQDFASLGANSLAAGLSATNIKLLFQGSYFQISPDAQPLLHYWSLAVEEQFYIIFPFYLYCIFRFSRDPLTITLLLGAASFAACVVITPLNPVHAFYLLPTRAWELLAGSSLALFRQNGGATAPRYASITVSAGLALLAISFLLISESGNFPGWMAAFPVLGAVLILASIEPARGHPIPAILAHPSLVFIGKRSYSLYLWHWPIFSFVDYRFFASGAALRLMLKLLICVVATLLTYSFVERPFRSYLNSRQHRALAFGGFAVAVFAACLGGMEIRSNNYFSADPRQISAGGITIKGTEGATVALIGDSQGAMYGAELASLAHVHGFSLNVLSVAAGNELPEEPGTHWPEIKRFLAERRPNVIVVAEAWSHKLGSDTQHLREALTSLESLGSQVILITQPPILPPNATREAIRAGTRPPFFEEPKDRETRQRASASVGSLASSRLLVIDVADIFLEHGSAIKLIAENGRFTYHDSGHLTDAGTALVRPILERAVIDALRSRWHHSRN